MRESLCSPLFETKVSDERKHRQGRSSCKVGRKSAGPSALTCCRGMVRLSDRLKRRQLIPLAALSKVTSPSVPEGQSPPEVDQLSHGHACKTAAVSKEKMCVLDSAGSFAAAALSSTHAVGAMSVNVPPSQMALGTASKPVSLFLFPCHHRQPHPCQSSLPAITGVKANTFEGCPRHAACA